MRDSSSLIDLNVGENEIVVDGPDIQIGIPVDISADLGGITHESGPEKDRLGEIILAGGTETQDHHIVGIMIVFRPITFLQLGQGLEHGGGLDGFGSFSERIVVGDGDGGEDPDDRDHDHEFDQGKS